LFFALTIENLDRLRLKSFGEDIPIINALLLERQTVLNLTSTHLGLAFIPLRSIPSRRNAVNFRSRCEWDESKRGFCTEEDANTYKSGCERFQNIQKTMRTVLSVALSRAGLTVQWAGKRLGWTNVEVGCRNELTLE